MTRSLVVTAALAAAVGLAAGGAAQAGPSMSTNWTETTLDQAECMRQAERAVRGSGLGQDIDIVGQSVFGKRAGYTGVIRCIAEKGLIYFVVGGPSLDEAKKYMRNLFDKF